VTPTFLVVSAAATAYFIAIGMVLPTLPRYVKDELGGGGVAIGLAGGALAVTAALLRPWVGRTGDRAGRRRLVVSGCLVVAVSLVGYALSTTLVALIAARLVTGVGEAMMFVGAATAIQDMAPPSRRAEAASYFSLAIWGGTGVGPVLAEWIREQHGFDAVWGVAAAFCVLGAILGRWTPPGPHSVIDPNREKFHPVALRPGVVLMLGVVGLAAFQTFAALYADDLGTKAGPVFGLYSVIVLAMRLFGAGVADRYGARRVAGIGLTVEAVALVIIAAWSTPVGLYVGAVLLALGFAPVYPALLSLVVDVAPDDERTSAMSTFSLFFDLATGLGLPVLGVVAAAGGERSTFAVAAALPVLAVVMLRLRVPEPARHVEGPIPVLDDREI
jgi:MFS family permease